jgi:hypothetical protein
MATVEGHQAVTVRMPSDLKGRVALEYGFKTDFAPATSVTFVPCADQPRTSWPGGLVFTSREPISLLVAEGSGGQNRVLHLGTIHPLGYTPPT